MKEGRRARDGAKRERKKRADGRIGDEPKWRETCEDEAQDGDHGSKGGAGGQRGRWARSESLRGGNSSSLADSRAQAGCSSQLSRRGPSGRTSLPSMLASGRICDMRRPASALQRATQAPRCQLLRVSADVARQRDGPCARRKQPQTSKRGNRTDSRSHSRKAAAAAEADVPQPPCRAGLGEGARHRPSHYPGGPGGKVGVAALAGARVVIVRRWEPGHRELAAPFGGVHGRSAEMAW